MPFGKRLFRRSARLFGTGIAMGSADIVPGVSGGTIAFILGVYEDLIAAIKTVSGPVIKLLLQGKVKAAIASIPFGFLIPLFLGIGTAIIGLSRIILHLLQTQQSFLYAFFFGMVAASIRLVARRVTRWHTPTILMLIGLTIIAYQIVGAVPTTTPQTLPYFFLAGAIGICAMILPGISGSFLLLILGKYEQIIQALHDRNLLVIGVFSLGAIVGISLFSRVLSWLFAKYHNLTVAALTGFMLGSLRKLWPWKEVIATRINSHGIEVPLQDINIIPATLDTTVLLTAAISLGGFLLILILDKLQQGKAPHHR
jgi:putative membrane protein